MKKPATHRQAQPSKSPFSALASWDMLDAVHSGCATTLHLPLVGECDDLTSYLGGCVLNALNAGKPRPYVMLDVFYYYGANRINDMQRSGWPRIPPGPLIADHDRIHEIFPVRHSPCKVHCQQSLSAQALPANRSLETDLISISSKRLSILAPARVSADRILTGCANNSRSHATFATHPIAANDGATKGAHHCVVSCSTCP